MLQRNNHTVTQREHFGQGNAAPHNKLSGYFTSGFIREKFHYHYTSHPSRHPTIGTVTSAAQQILLLGRRTPAPPPTAPAPIRARRRLIAIESMPASQYTRAIEEIYLHIKATHEPSGKRL
ncbi:hypothetical protein [Chromobacterium sphagni]|uniref:hypothetical protein n=1 Tax=Chromobacterium sphagni TaxID=1903179 RepID=UPI00130121AE|nr:hypothetical protein [Chromobacterium sphagni]